MHQPFLSTASITVAAPLQAWSAPDGQADGLAPQRVVEGVYCGDVRVVSQLVLECPSHLMEHITTEQPGGGRSGFQYVLRTPDLGVDPALLLHRLRELDGEGLTERLVLSTASPEDLEVELVLRLRPDATAMQEIKSGVSGHPVDTVAPQGAVARWGWRDERTRAAVEVGQGGSLAATDGEYLARWTVTVPARGTAEVSLRLSAADAGSGFGPCTLPPLQPPAAAGSALRNLLATSFNDINGLRMAQPGRPDHAFLAAGAPWYFTLFGRDSIISAMNLVPHDLTIAAGTLRVLAGLQGTKVDVDSAEQPGKILHEVRQEPLELEVEFMGQHDGHISLPPLYYGTIDATCLWIMLLDRAELAGLDQAVVDELMPALRAALGWITDHGDADGDGFLEYIDRSGHGLANQGWKDSGDSVRFADGRLATGPVALCEVQGYAHAALLAGARLLEAHDGDEEAAQHLRDAATQLAERFRDRFWAGDELGRYPVLALDGQKQQVDGVASNMGHLLGTGICSPDEENIIVERLMHPTMRSGYGIRTLSTTNGGYWPLGYHVGSVWTHDTAYILDGMLRQGFHDQARELALELLHAGEGFGHRFPELFGGMPADQVYPPQPYPASCRPQAWAATSSVVVARALA